MENTELVDFRSLLYFMKPNAKLEKDLPYTQFQVKTNSNG